MDERYPEHDSENPGQTHTLTIVSLPWQSTIQLTATCDQFLICGLDLPGIGYRYHHPEYCDTGITVRRRNSNPSDLISHTSSSHACDRFSTTGHIRPDGGTGRHVGFKHRCYHNVWVRIPLRAFKLSKIWISLFQTKID